MPPKGRKRLEVKVEAGALEALSKRVTASFSRNILLFACRSSSPFGSDDRIFGGYIGGVTPVPIPNTEVKSSRADGTSRETARESRSLPDSFRPPDSRQAGFFSPAQAGGQERGGEPPPASPSGAARSEPPPSEEAGGRGQAPARVAKRIVCALK